MKKIFKILLIMIFLIPFTVKADMGAPDMRPYKLIVTAENGIDYYSPADTNKESIGKINKDEIIEVIYEYNNSYEIKYGEKDAKIYSLDGTKTLNDTDDPEKAEGVKKYNKSYKAYIANKDGVDIYAGIGNAYKKVGHINSGKTVTFRYATINTYGVIDYIFVDYNGSIGWVKCISANVLIENNIEDLDYANNIYYLFIKDYKTKCDTSIPANTIIKPEYVSDQWGRKIYVKYNNCEEVIDYEFKPNDNDTVTNLYASNKKIKLNSELTLYKNPNTNSEIIGNVPANTTIYNIRDVMDVNDWNKGYRLVDYNGTRGWINYDENSEPYIDEGEYKISELVNSSTTTTDTTTDTTTVEDTTTDGTTGDVVVPTNNDNNEIVVMGIIFVVICVFFGFVIAITAVVIIVLINKSKKKKNEVKVEVNEEK